MIPRLRLNKIFSHNRDTLILPPFIFHFISYQSDVIQNDFVILHLDTHVNLRDGYTGKSCSHAVALRCCLDDEAVHHGVKKIRLVSYMI